MKPRTTTINNLAKRAAMTMLLAVITAATAWAAQPQRHLDVCTGGAGFIHVQGWAYDPDASTQSIDVHVYIYTNAGCTSQFGDYHVLTTNVSRPDVNSAKGITGNHGFSSTIPIADAGSYWVKVFAIDTNGNGNPQIGSTTKVTVTAGNVVTLTSETGEVTLQDGDILTGTGGVGSHVVIAAGATVTLSGVDIYTIVNVYEERYPWPAISCQGDAIIILDDGTNNRVKSNCAWYPGIYIPSGYTLTIRGKGSLEASNSGAAAAIGAGAGIDLDCGNIRIEDGNITATGVGNVIFEGNVTPWSNHAAAIGGCGGGDCGDITITGGKVDATGAVYAAAIGGGNQGKCGNITIPPGVTYVKTYLIGEKSPYSIGPGAGGTCGTVTIGGVTGYTTDKKYIYTPKDIPYTVTFNANGGTGTTTTQGFYSNTPQALIANTFTRTGYCFLGWSTKADGSGNNYANGETVNNLGNVTLYAQWKIHTYNITYNLNGGTNASSNPATYTILSNAIMLAEPTRFGFIFDGWTYDGQDEPTKDVTIAHSSHGDKSFTAHWTPATVELTTDIGYYKLVNGHTLTGTGGTETHVTIADGATITLSGVTITDIADYNAWAGISCEGNATIILADGTTNTVKGGYGNLPGVTVPSGKTLTIRGSGTLIAGSKYNGAGIGGGYAPCGNIIIEGGIIIATGGNGAAGIGAGQNMPCGNITITDGVTSVTATAGWGAPYCIGSSSNSTAGTVTIGNVVTGSISQRSVTYTPSDTTPYTVTFDANGGEGSMDTQEFISNTPQALTANSFTRTNYEFDGWNTAANGSGYAYRDRQAVINLGNVTLYAQWKPVLITKILNSSIGDVELVDGDIVSGTGGENTHVTIADGATVTLYNVNITNIKIDKDHKWAGITCLGNATIIVKGSNAVKGSYESAGVFVPSGKTLIITGDGSLTATAIYSSAGIGGNRETNCGNIIIEGGTITAVASMFAAGIGGGRLASCGDITIRKGVTCVSARTDLSNGDQAIIGKGFRGPVGNITIDPELTDVTEGYTRRLYHSLTLVDNADNVEAVNRKDGLTCLTATLQGRTLYKDGGWNTLCLPFAVSNLSGTPLEGATVMELDGATSNLDSDGQPTLNFTETTSIEAGKPYIVKWGTPADLVISTTADWDCFAESVNSGTESYEGKLVRLTNDISVTTMVGTWDVTNNVADRMFCGTFDGNGHTLTALIDEKSTMLAAPFRAIGGATIKNLKVVGTVNGGIHCGGLVGVAENMTTNSITNCEVAVAVTTTGSHCGGVLGHGRSSKTTISDCLFSGSINGANTATGIFYGWGDDGMHTIENCLFTGSVTGVSIDLLKKNGSHGTATVTNCYKTQNIGSQGTYTTATGSDLQAMLGDGWEVSGSLVVPKMTANIANPVFKDVTIDATAPAPIAFDGGQLVGSYSTFRATLKFGDVDGDGETDTADLKALTDYLTGKADTPSAPDVNGDTKVDITDVATLIGIIVSPQPVTSVVSNVAGISLDTFDGTR